MSRFGQWLRSRWGAVSGGIAPPPAPLPAAAPTTFGLALYAALRQQPGNLVWSPYSLRTALAMAALGARGNTASQMAAVLGPAEPDTAFAASRSPHLGPSGASELAVANSLWGQQGAPLDPRYVEVVGQQFGGRLHLVDFQRQAAAVRETINRWVAEQTRERIRDLIPPGGLTAATRLVLANAVYFSGRWELPFDVAATRAAPFYRATGGQVTVPLMQQQGLVRYQRAAGYQAVELPYQGGDLALLVLLPDRPDGLPSLEATLTPAMLGGPPAPWRETLVQLWLPRCRLTWAAGDLCQQLVALGMPAACDPTQADFAGLNGLRAPHPEALFISQVFHQAQIDVHEAGTTAAAATAVVLQRCGAAAGGPPPVPIFRADHPFLFALLHRASRCLLFLGRVTDPGPTSPAA